MRHRFENGKLERIIHYQEDCPKARHLFIMKGASLFRKEATIMDLKTGMEILYCGGKTGVHRELP